MAQRLPLALPPSHAPFPETPSSPWYALASPPRGRDWCAPGSPALCSDLAAVTPPAARLRAWHCSACLLRGCALRPSVGGVRRSPAPQWPAATPARSARSCHGQSTPRTAPLWRWGHARGSPSLPEASEGACRALPLLAPLPSEPAGAADPGPLGPSHGKRPPFFQSLPRTCPVTCQPAHALVRVRSVLGSPRCPEGWSGSLPVPVPQEFPGGAH